MEEILLTKLDRIKVPTKKLKAEKKVGNQEESSMY